MKIDLKKIVNGEKNETHQLKNSIENQEKNYWKYPTKFKQI